MIPRFSSKNIPEGRAGVMLNASISPPIEFNLIESNGTSLLNR